MSKQTTEDFFEMLDYRTYIQSWAKARGRGVFQKMSIALDIHSSLTSQILTGRKSLTEEQAAKLAIYMDLKSLETDYFLKLVQMERAGTTELKMIFSRHLKKIRDQSNEIKTRVPEAKIMSDQDRGLFYSSWQYSLIRLLTSIPRFQNREKIALHLGLSISRVQEILDFLVTRGLCTYEKGCYLRTEINTHIEARSPLSIRHHQNWRAKSFELFEKMTSKDLAFTAPVALSNNDTPKVRKILMDAIEEISKIVANSATDEISYLAIDWIKL